MPANARKRGEALARGPAIGTIEPSPKGSRVGCFLATKAIVGPIRG
jgi:hypothetical protein